DRKHAAAQELHAALTAKDGLSRQDLLQLLARIKQQFGLSAAKLEERGGQTQVGLYASPALFVPIAIGGNISGQKPGAKVPTRASVLAGDYIRSTAHDGPFPTPAAEVRTNFNNRFQGQVSGYAGGGGGGGHVAKKAKIPILIPALAAGNIALKTAGVGATYRRAGRVEAKSSVVRGTGRSGNGETIFGHFGNDEEKIKTGAAATSYNGGHLVGDQIMDSHRAFDLYADWNLAPQVRGFNSPVYTSTIENPVTSAIRAGATVTYVVNVSYPDNQYTVKPALLAARLWPGANLYKAHVLNAIALTPALNANFLFRRRTPGAWRATASVVAGGQTISSGKISKRPNVAYDNKFRSLRSDRNYNPVGGEQVRYGVATYSAGVAGGKRQVNAGPNPKHYKYKGATTVTVTARQQTF
ncbi:MAG: DNA/RNA non-specific endonuclease, partial [Burkholderiales bacterium]|nr:DNA/RNA non-specific endonuclease [Burkholderiales bacterium]